MSTESHDARLEREVAACWAALHKMFREVRDTPSFVPDPAEERRTRTALENLRHYRAER